MSEMVDLTPDLSTPSSYEAVTSLIISDRSRTAFAVYRHEVEVLLDTLSDELAQSDRHGIPDHPAELLEMYRPSFWQEGVTLWETLEDGSFPEGNGAVLFWVAISTVPKPEELGRESR